MGRECITCHFVMNLEPQAYCMPFVIKLEPPLSCPNSVVASPFSVKKGEGFFGVFEPQRKSCDVRDRSTLWSLFNLDDKRNADNNHNNKKEALAWGEVEVKTWNVNNINDANGTNPWFVFIQGQLRLWFSSDGLLFNAVEGLNKTGLSYIRRKKTGIPVLAIGPTCSLLIEKLGNDCNRCIDWLNSCPQDSVLYISFGSQNTISSTQMMELVKALEASSKNFIWVVRPPVEFDINSEFYYCLRASVTFKRCLPPPNRIN
ncbi:UDP-glycosyltransferase 92A1-like [Macadamia integrifolia]|uniref:UDP-glycosyltransferase 92A1-like n=1 Tax=Macadamia integrifolia TaxID=60698 RepID=UPI001C4FC61B|nr:UDP-glycosyltransferase 92A1-like [Macadamia integrifolia]